MTEDTEEMSADQQTGPHCDLCGCSFPAVRCDKCNSQIFCLSCDDMYHKHPKRQFHLRKAVDSIAGTLRTQRKHSTLPGDPSKIPIPPPRRKKKGRGIFAWGKSNPEIHSFTTREFWPESLSRTRQFMGNRPLPPSPREASSEPSVTVVPQNLLQPNYENVHASPLPKSASSSPELNHLGLAHNDRENMNIRRSSLNQQIKTVNDDKEIINGENIQGNLQDETGWGQEVRLPPSSAAPPPALHPKAKERLLNGHDSPFNLDQRSMTPSSNVSQGQSTQLRNQSPQQLHLPFMHHSMSATDLPSMGVMPHPSFPYHCPPPHMPVHPYAPHPYSHSAFHSNCPQCLSSSWSNLAHPHVPPFEHWNSSRSNQPQSPQPPKNTAEQEKPSFTAPHDPAAYAGPYYPCNPGTYPFSGPHPFHYPGHHLPLSPTFSDSFHSLHRGTQKMKMRSESPSVHSSPAHTNREQSQPLPSSGEEEVMQLEEHELSSRQEESEKEEISDASSEESESSKKAPEKPNKPWECKHCTFINLPGSHICAVCCRTSYPSHSKNQKKAKQKELSTTDTGSRSSHSPSVSDIKDGKRRVRKKTQEKRSISPVLDQEMDIEKVTEGIEEVGESSKIPELQNKELESSIKPRMTAESEKEMEQKSSLELEETIELKHVEKSKEPEKDVELTQTLKVESETKHSDTIDSNHEEKPKEEEQESKEAETQSLNQQSSLILKQNVSVEAKEYDLVELHSKTTETQTMDTDTISDIQKLSVSVASLTDPLYISKSELKEISCQTEQKTETEMISIATDPMISTQSIESLLSIASATPYISIRGLESTEHSYSTQSIHDRSRLQGLSVPRAYSLHGDGLTTGKGSYGTGESSLRSWNRPVISPDPMYYYRPHSLGRFSGLSREDYYDVTWGSTERLNRGQSKYKKEEKWRETLNSHKSRMHRSLEELKHDRRADSPRIQEMEFLHMVKEAERFGYTVEDLHAALNHCGREDPIIWLENNWKGMIENVISIALKFGDESEDNDVGMISDVEAKEALRLHKGNVYDAVTECIEIRQRKILELSTRGSFSQKEIVEALAISEGDVELAYADLTETTDAYFEQTLRRSPYHDTTSLDFRTNTYTSENIDEFEDTNLEESKFDRKRSEFLSKLFSLRKTRMERKSLKGKDTKKEISTLKRDEEIKTRTMDKIAAENSLFLQSNLEMGISATVESSDENVQSPRSSQVQSNDVEDFVFVKSPMKLSQISATSQGELGESSLGMDAALLLLKADDNLKLNEKDSQVTFSPFDKSKMTESQNESEVLSQINSKSIKPGGNNATSDMPPEEAFMSENIGTKETGINHVKKLQDHGHSDQTYKLEMDMQDSNKYRDSRITHNELLLSADKKEELILESKCVAEFSEIAPEEMAEDYDGLPEDLDGHWVDSQGKWIEEYTEEELEEESQGDWIALEYDDSKMEMEDNSQIIQNVVNSLMEKEMTCLEEEDYQDKRTSVSSTNKIRQDSSEEWVKVDYTNEAISDTDNTPKDDYISSELINENISLDQKDSFEKMQTMDEHESNFIQMTKNTTNSDNWVTINARTEHSESHIIDKESHSEWIEVDDLASFHKGDTVHVEGTLLQTEANNEQDKCIPLIENRHGESKTQETSAELKHDEDIPLPPPRMKTKLSSQRSVPLDEAAQELKLVDESPISDVTFEMKIPKQQPSVETSQMLEEMSKELEPEIASKESILSVKDSREKEIDNIVKSFFEKEAKFKKETSKQMIDIAEPSADEKEIILPEINQVVKNIDSTSYREASQGQLPADALLTGDVDSVKMSQLHESKMTGKEELSSLENSISTTTVKMLPEQFVPLGMTQELQTCNESIIPASSAIELKTEKIEIVSNIEQKPEAVEKPQEKQEPETVEELFSEGLFAGADYFFGRYNEVTFPKRGKKKQINQRSVKKPLVESKEKPVSVPSLTKVESSSKELTTEPKEKQSASEIIEKDRSLVAKIVEPTKIIEPAKPPPIEEAPLSFAEDYFFGPYREISVKKKNSKKSKPKSLPIINQKSTEGALSKDMSQKTEEKYIQQTHLETSRGISYSQVDTVDQDFTKQTNLKEITVIDMPDASIPAAQKMNVTIETMVSKAESKNESSVFVERKTECQNQQTLLSEKPDKMQESDIVSEKNQIAGNIVLNKEIASSSLEPFAPTSLESLPSEPHPLELQQSLPPPPPEQVPLESNLSKPHPSHPLPSKPELLVQKRSSLIKQDSEPGESIGDCVEKVVPHPKYQSVPNLSNIEEEYLPSAAEYFFGMYKEVVPAVKGKKKQKQAQKTSMFASQQTKQVIKSTILQDTDFEAKKMSQSKQQETTIMQPMKTGFESVISSGVEKSELKKISMSHPDFEVSERHQRSSEKLIGSETNQTITIDKMKVNQKEQKIIDVSEAQMNTGKSQELHSSMSENTASQAHIITLDNQKPLPVTNLNTATKCESFKKSDQLVPASAEFFFGPYGQYSTPSFLEENNAIVYNQSELISSSEGATFNQPTLPLLENDANIPINNVALELSEGSANKSDKQVALSSSESNICKGTSTYLSESSSEITSQLSDQHIPTKKEFVFGPYGHYSSLSSQVENNNNVQNQTSNILGQDENNQNASFKSEFLEEKNKEICNKIAISKKVTPDQNGNILAGNEMIILTENTHKESFNENLNDDNNRINSASSLMPKNQIECLHSSLISSSSSQDHILQESSVTEIKSTTIKNKDFQEEYVPTVIGHMYEEFIESVYPKQYVCSDKMSNKYFSKQDNTNDSDEHSLEEEHYDSFPEEDSDEHWADASVCPLPHSQERMGKLHTTVSADSNKLVQNCVPSLKEMAAQQKIALAYQDPGTSIVKQSKSAFVTEKQENYEAELQMKTQTLEREELISKTTTDEKFFPTCSISNQQPTELYLNEMQLSNRSEQLTCSDYADQFYHDAVQLSEEKSSDFITNNVQNVTSFSSSHRIDEKDASHALMLSTLENKIEEGQMKFEDTLSKPIQEVTINEAPLHQKLSDEIKSQATEYVVKHQETMDFFNNKHLLQELASEQLEEVSNVREEIMDRIVPETNETLSSNTFSTAVLEQKAANKQTEESMTVTSSESLDNLNLCGAITDASESKSEMIGHIITPPLASTEAHLIENISDQVKESLLYDSDATDIVSGKKKQINELQQNLNELSASSELPLHMETPVINNYRLDKDYSLDENQQKNSEFDLPSPLFLKHEVASSSQDKEARSMLTEATEKEIHSVHDQKMTIIGTKLQGLKKEDTYDQFMEAENDSIVQLQKVSSSQNEQGIESCLPQDMSSDKKLAMKEEQKLNISNQVENINLIPSSAPALQNETKFSMEETQKVTLTEIMVKVNEQKASSEINDIEIKSSPTETTKYAQLVEANDNSLHQMKAPSSETTHEMEHCLESEFVKSEQNNVNNEVMLSDISQRDITSICEDETKLLLDKKQREVLSELTREANEPEYYQEITKDKINLDTVEGTSNVNQFMKIEKEEMTQVLEFHTEGEHQEESGPGTKDVKFNQQKAQMIEGKLEKESHSSPLVLTVLEDEIQFGQHEDKESVVVSFAKDIKNFEINDAEKEIRPEKETMQNEPLNIGTIKTSEVEELSLPMNHQENVNFKDLTSLEALNSSKGSITEDLKLKLKTSEINSQVIYNSKVIDSTSQTLEGEKQIAMTDTISPGSDYLFQQSKLDKQTVEEIDKKIIHSTCVNETKSKYKADGINLTTVQNSEQISDERLSLNESNTVEHVIDKEVTRQNKDLTEAAFIRKKFSLSSESSSESGEQLPPTVEFFYGGFDLDAANISSEENLQHAYQHHESSKCDNLLSSEASSVTYMTSDSEICDKDKIKSLGKFITVDKSTASPQKEVSKVAEKSTESAHVFTTVKINSCLKSADEKLLNSTEMAESNESGDLDLIHSDETSDATLHTYETADDETDPTYESADEISDELGQVHERIGHEIIFAYEKAIEAFNFDETVSDLFHFSEAADETVCFCETANEILHVEELAHAFETADKIAHVYEIADKVVHAYETADEETVCSYETADEVVHAYETADEETLCSYETSDEVTQEYKTPDETIHSYETAAEETCSYETAAEETCSYETAAEETFCYETADEMFHVHKTSDHIDYTYEITDGETLHNYIKSATEQVHTSPVVFHNEGATSQDVLSSRNTVENSSLEETSDTTEEIPPSPDSEHRAWMEAFYQDREQLNSAINEVDYYILEENSHDYTADGEYNFTGGDENICSLERVAENAWENIETPANIRRPSEDSDYHWADATSHTYSSEEEEDSHYWADIDTSISEQYEGEDWNDTYRTSDLMDSAQQWPNAYPDIPYEERNSSELWVEDDTDSQTESLVESSENWEETNETEDTEVDDNYMETTTTSPEKDSGGEDRVRIDLLTEQESTSQSESCSDFRISSQDSFTETRDENLASFKMEKVEKADSRKEAVEKARREAKETSLFHGEDNICHTDVIPSIHEKKSDILAKECDMIREEKFETLTKESDKVRKDVQDDSELKSPIRSKLKQLSTEPLKEISQFKKVTNEDKDAQSFMTNKLTMKGPLSVEQISETSTESERLSRENLIGDITSQASVLVQDENVSKSTLKNKQTSTVQSIKEQKSSISNVTKLKGDSEHFLVEEKCTKLMNTKQQHEEAESVSLMTGNLLENQVAISKFQLEDSASISQPHTVTGKVLKEVQKIPSFAEGKDSETNLTVAETAVQLKETNIMQLSTVGQNKHTTSILQQVEPDVSKSKGTSVINRQKEEDILEVAEVGSRESSQLDQSVSGGPDPIVKDTSEIVTVTSECKDQTQLPLLTKNTCGIETSSSIMNGALKPELSTLIHQNQTANESLGQNLQSESGVPKLPKKSQKKKADEDMSCEISRFAPSDASRLTKESHLQIVDFPKSGRTVDELECSAEKTLLIKESDVSSYSMQLGIKSASQSSQDLEQDFLPSSTNIVTKGKCYQTSQVVSNQKAQAVTPPPRRTRSRQTSRESSVSDISPAHTPVHDEQLIKKENVIRTESPLAAIKEKEITQSSLETSGVSLSLHSSSLETQPLPSPQLPRKVRSRQSNKESAATEATAASMQVNIPLTRTDSPLTPKPDELSHRYTHEQIQSLMEKSATPPLPRKMRSRQPSQESSQGDISPGCTPIQTDKLKRNSLGRVDSPLTTSKHFEDNQPFSEHSTLKSMPSTFSSANQLLQLCDVAENSGTLSLATKSHGEEDRSNLYAAQMKPETQLSDTQIIKKSQENTSVISDSLLEVSHVTDSGYEQTQKTSIRTEKIPYSLKTVKKDDMSEIELSSQSLMQLKSYSKEISKEETMSLSSEGSQQEEFERTNRNALTSRKRTSFELRMSKLKAEGKVSTSTEAQIAAKLIEMQFDEGEALDASKQCSTVYNAVKFLQQLCPLCGCRFPAYQMDSMVHCTHQACRECLKAHFTTLIQDKNILCLVCPVCEQPNLTEDNMQEYFNLLDQLLRNIVEPQIHDLFQQKLRDRVLMKDPNFYWCSNCSSGYISDPRFLKQWCPDCQSATCLLCHQTWEQEHDGVSCEMFQRWKDNHTPEPPPCGLVKELEEHGIDCPSCGLHYTLARGGNLFFHCPHCQEDFCSYCKQLYRKGEECSESDLCFDIGTHAHHPCNCLFFLRDKDIVDLQRLLSEHCVSYFVKPPEGFILKKRCQVRELKETLSGLTEDKCGRQVTQGCAGLCRLHYKEYLVDLAKCHDINPVPSLTVPELHLMLRKSWKLIPERLKDETLEEYRTKLIMITLEEIPMDRSEGT